MIAQLAKQSSVREVKESITVKDYNRFLKAVEKDPSISTHLERKYQKVDQNVFLYNTKVKQWLDSNKIDYRVNWERVIL